MRTLFFDPRPELVEKVEQSVLDSPYPVESFIHMTAMARNEYVNHANDFIGKEFKSDHLMDDSGTMHEMVYFPILDMRRDEEGCVWAVGQEFQINVTEFFDGFIQLFEDLRDRIR